MLAQPLLLRHTCCKLTYSGKGTWYPVSINAFAVNRMYLWLPQSPIMDSQSRLKWIWDFCENATDTVCLLPVVAGAANPINEYYWKNKTGETLSFISADISMFNMLININHGSETETGNQSASPFFPLSPWAGRLPAHSTAAKALSIWHTFTEHTSTIIPPTPPPNGPHGRWMGK